MLQYIKENIGGFIGLIVILGIISIIPISVTHEHKQRKNCNSLRPITTQFQLVSLFDYQNVSKKSSMSGGFFLMMGAVGGTSTEDLKYYIRYAYEDQYGVKLMTEEIDNRSKIRIKEVKDQAPKMVIKYKKDYFHMTGCSDKEIMRIFEIPEGTVYKTFEIDMK